jgi:RNA polymerase sigma factor (sigma-70 family)
MMRNRVRAERKKERSTRHAVRCYADRIQSLDDQRPDQVAIRRERASQARFIVYHVLTAPDRKLLGWYYWDGLSAAEIATRLGIKEAAVWQRLVRARARAKQALKI